MKNLNRRNFLKTMGAAGFGIFSAKELNAQDPNDSSLSPKLPQVPKRVLGKTGVEVPILSLGTMYNLIDNQIMLRRSLDWGVNYWDTSNVYAGGNSELGIGRYFKRHPDERKNVFLVTKASVFNEPLTAEKMEARLKLSLERMSTEYIDLFFGPHALSDPKEMTDELKQWAKSAKDRGLIKYFGFSTHQNMAQCLMAASQMDWVDVIMTTYNFRVMQDEKLIEGIDQCHKAGIGLIAMKITGKSTLEWSRQDIETDADKKFLESLLENGYSAEQACIKLVLQDQRIASACVGMENMAVLTANAAAVLDKVRFTQAEIQAFENYANATCSGYCAGCGNICAQASGMPYVSDIMRCLMYHNSYGDSALAKEQFALIPAEFRNRMLNFDYTSAQAACPQRMPIAELIKEAADKLC